MFKESAPNFGLMLSGSDQFVIPVYQRGFSWKMTQGVDLFEDVSAYSGSESDDCLFLGTCILKKKGQVFEVVDGQQRLTTLMLLLVACRTRALQLDETETAFDISGRIAFRDTRGKTKGPKLVASPNVSDVFEHIVAGNWDGKFPDKIGKKPVKRQRRLLEPLYLHFLKELQSLEGEAFFDFLDSIYNSRFIRIDVDEEINALAIFERTNARGAELEVSDLLKNHLFQSAAGEIQEKWDSVSENADGQLPRMLKYFFVSERGYVQKKDLYAKLKPMIKAAGVEPFVEQLASFSQYFLAFRQGTPQQFVELFDQLGIESISRDQSKVEQFVSSVAALRDFGMSQPIPVIYAAIQCLLRNNPDQYRPLLRLVDAMEKFHFVNNVICTRLANDVEHLYAKACVKLTKTTDFNATVNELVSDLKKRLADRDEFVGQFSELEYSSSSIPTIAYFFDRLQNYGARPGSRITIYDPSNKTLKRRKYDVEHFSAQNPAESIDEETARRVNSIGNLLVISEQTNKLLSNKSPSKKFGILSASPDASKFNFVKSFLDEYGVNPSEWGGEKIEDRARRLGEDAYDRVFALK